MTLDARPRGELVAVSAATSWHATAVASAGDVDAVYRA